MRLQVDGGALRGVVRALAGDRVVEHDRVGHARARRAPTAARPTGLRTVGGKRPARMPLSSVSSMSRQRSASQGMNVSRIHFDCARGARLRRRDVGPAVHRAAGDALEDHDLAGPARRQRREDEVLAHARDEVEAHGGELGPRRHARHVRERERAHAAASYGERSASRSKSCGSRPCRRRRSTRSWLAA